MSVPKRSQAFPERMEQPPFPAFPSVPLPKGGRERWERPELRLGRLAAHRRHLVEKGRGTVMTDEETAAKQVTANQVAEYIRHVLVVLREQHGLPWDCIAAGVHAEAVNAMTQIVGGPMAALCCERAADRVRNMPSAKVQSLAFAVPMGRA